MSSETFDVSAVFLSGMAIDRSIHIRTPSCSLPSVWRISKNTTHPTSTDGLTEAPRLWYLRARERLRCARAVFVKHDFEKKLKEILSLVWALADGEMSTMCSFFFEKWLAVAFCSFNETGVARRFFLNRCLSATLFTSCALLF